MNLESMKNKTVGMILQFSIPSIIAMVLSSLITIVDGYFIGNYVGKEGIAAVNLGLPILYIYLGIGIMISVGGISIAGRTLGAGEQEKSKDVFNQTVITSFLCSAIVTVVVFVLFGQILRLMTMDPLVAEGFEQYYRIMIFAYPVMIVNASLGMFIRGEGNPHLFMLINVITVACNIILDYIFIAKLGHGIPGAAVASLISLLVGLCCMIFYFLKKSVIYKFRTFVFSKSVLKDTIFNGMAELIGQVSMSISMFAYNWVILRTEGVQGVAAFTIIGYIAYLFGMVIVGFGQGASPLISYAFGAREFELSKRIRKITNFFVFISGAVVMVFLTFAAGWYSKLFVDNKNVTELIHSGILIFMISFLFSGINTITTFYFSSIGKAKESMLISSSRGLVVLLLCIIILPIFLGMTGVWMVAPVTEVITVILTFVLLGKNDRLSIA